MRKLIYIIFLFSFFGQAQDHWNMWLQASLQQASVAPNDYYTNLDAAHSTDVNAAVNWIHPTAGTTVTSVANTDTEGGSWALDIASSSAEIYNRAELAITGLPLVPITMTIRTRAVAGSNLFFNLTNMSNLVISDDFTANGTNWFTATITGTPTTGTVAFRVYTEGASPVGNGHLQINHITILED